MDRAPQVRRAFELLRDSGLNAADATYTDTQGASVETVILIDTLLGQSDLGQQVLTRGASITCLREDVPSPQRGDTLVTASRTWVIEKPRPGLDDAVIVVDCYEQ